MGARHLVALAVALVIVTVGAASCSRGPAIDARVTVNDHQLHVVCHGGPGPTVMFEPGVGGDHSLWPIADRVASGAVVCLYDRPGDGEAPPPASARTARTDVADLHALLAEASIPGPVIMVGHSYGGLVAWMEGAEHPEEVAGIILIDPTHPDPLGRLDAVLSADQQARFDAAFPTFPVAFLASAQEAAAELDAFPSLPTTIITASRSMDPWCSQGLPCADMQQVVLSLADDYAALQPGIRHFVVPTSHYVQNDDPDLVVGEIERMIGLLGKHPSAPSGGRAPVLGDRDAPVEGGIATGRLRRSYAVARSLGRPRRP